MLFDPQKIRKQHQRACLNAASEGKTLRETAFLHHLCIQEMHARLTAFRRCFHSILDMTDAIGDPPSFSGKEKKNVLRAGTAQGFGFPFVSDSRKKIRSKTAFSTGPQLVVDLETLPFVEQSFDLILSALTLHFVNNLPQTLAQIRHCLKPEGVFMAALLGGDTLFELRKVLIQAESELCGGLSPRCAPSIDLREIGGALQNAGFVFPVVDQETVILRYKTPTALFHDLRRMALTNPLAARQKTCTSPHFFRFVDQLYTQNFADKEGFIPARFELIYLHGWASSSGGKK